MHCEITIRFEYLRSVYSQFLSLECTVSSLFRNALSKICVVTKCKTTEQMKPMWADAGTHKTIVIFFRILLPISAAIVSSASARVIQLPGKTNY